MQLLVLLQFKVGANIVQDQSNNLPWYKGPSMYEILTNICCIDNPHNLVSSSRTLIVYVICGIYIRNSVTNEMKPVIIKITIILQPILHLPCFTITSGVDT
ncbi:hypothetical protein RF11_06786 [Thelohanellus kitauei]|uniref:Uncharacterized protein n=1 Tax=Thelohanellus kitauei TaxID=669202 RepID=A0A0C2N358_THEKT|nr:hypothetical protein RF11_06786 [Thelohanellus kitauei]